MALISALALSIGMFILLGGNLSHTLRKRLLLTGEKDHGKKPQGPKRQNKGAWVTKQSLLLLGWSQQTVRMASVVSVAVLGGGWFVLTHNVVAGGLMGIIGWQLPGIAAEVKAAGMLKSQVRQVASFVGTFADNLETGKPVGQAVDEAARSITTPPLKDAAELVVRRLKGGSDIAEALGAISDRINMPTWDLFVDMVKLNQQVRRAPQIFRNLDWQFQEMDLVQVEFSTAISMFMSFIIVFFGIIVAAGPIEAMIDPKLWSYVTQHLSFIPMVTTTIAVILFGGIRKYSRLKVAI